MPNYERWGKRKAVKTRIASYFSGSKEESCFKFLWCTSDVWAQCIKELILDFALLGCRDSSSLIAASSRRSFIAKACFWSEDNSLDLALLPACWLTIQASAVGAQLVDGISITKYCTGVGHQAIYQRCLMGRREWIYVRVEQLRLLSMSGTRTAEGRSCSDGYVWVSIYHYLVKVLCGCRNQRITLIPCVSNEMPLCNVSHFSSKGFAEVFCS